MCICIYIYIYDICCGINETKQRGLELLVSL